MSLKTALLVDDDFALREFVFPRLARAAGLRLCTAASVDEGIGRLDSASFDVVFVDLHLGPASGLSLIEAASRQRPRPFIVVVSGTQQLREVSRAWRSGSNDFLHKPFDAAEFRAVLVRATRGRPLGSAAVQGLPPFVARFADAHGTKRGRAVLTARYQGQRNADIGARFGVAESTVKRRLREEYFRPLQSSHLMDLERAARAWFDEETLR